MGSGRFWKECVPASVHLHILSMHICADVERGTQPLGSRPICWVLPSKQRVSVK